MDHLTRFAHKLLRAQRASEYRLPSKPATQRFVDELLALLFPHHIGHYARKNIEGIQADFLTLRAQLLNLLHSLLPTLHTHPEAIVHLFFEQLPDIYELLWHDARAIYEGDPAAESLDEVIAAYPGFYAIFAYRTAHIFYEQSVPILPRLITEYAHYKTGIDIHPGAQIGRSFCIDHGTGIVIGETTVIGNNVKIYQGVSLGALSVSKELAKTKRHPTIEDNVIVYSNATILGGDTTIGHDSIIGGNVWLTRSVPPYSVVYNTFESKIRSKKRIEEQIMFYI